MGFYSGAILPAGRLLAAAPSRLSPAGALRFLDRPSGRLGVGAFAPPRLSYTRRCRTAIAIAGDKRSEGDISGDSPLFLNSDDDEKQVIVVPREMEERCFAGTPYIPVYVMLPVRRSLDVINDHGKLANPEILIEQLRALKSIKVDGVMVDCWWGIVEDSAPLVYNWDGYRHLFQIVRQLKLKLQVKFTCQPLLFQQCYGFLMYVCVPLPASLKEMF
ncbi:hypothetical protein BHM03_00051639 [Ensete ventricosum]|nr:hypothetical protein BHM03_00051639 [Ensete ventricosum]